MTQQRQRGMWKRTLGLIFQIRIPWALYIIQVVIGFISTNVSVAYIPYYTQMQTGRIDGLSTVVGYLGSACWPWWWGCWSTSRPSTPAPR